MKPKTFNTLFIILGIMLVSAFNGIKLTFAETVKPHLTPSPGATEKLQQTPTPISQPEIDKSELPKLTYEFENQLSLDIDLSTITPSDVKKAISVSIMQGVDLPASYCLLEPELDLIDSKPAIIKETSSLHKRTLPPDNTRLAGKICVCGYEENEPLNIILINPLGEVMLEEKVIAEAADYRETIWARNSVSLNKEETFPAAYCYAIDEISRFAFLPDDPLGEYTVEILSKDAKLTYTFELEKLTELAIYYVERLQGYVLAGFEPYEKIRILVYDQTNKFEGEGKLVLDEKGMGFLFSSNSELIIFVVRENLDLVRRLNRSLSQIITRRSIFLSPFADFTKAIEVIPNHSAAYEARAHYYRIEKKYDQALADYNKAIELDPTRVSAYQGRAELHEGLGNYEQAIVDFSKVIEFNPDNQYTYEQRAKLYVKLRNYKQAIADYSKIIELFPDNLYRSKSAYQERGALHYGQLNYDLAIADYSNAIGLSSDEAFNYYQRARLYDILEKYDLAVTDYMKAIELEQHSDDSYGSFEDFTRTIILNPNFAPAYYKRGLAHYEISNYGQSNRDLTKAIEIDPGYESAYRTRGNVYRDQGNIRQAIADYTQAIELDPGNALNYYQRAHLYDAQGRMELAIADYIQAITLDEHIDFLSEGLTDLNRVIELAPDFALAYFRRGVAYFNSRMQAFPWNFSSFAQAVELNTKSALVQYEQNFNYFINQNRYNIDQAITDLTKSIELDPDYPTAHEKRGDVYVERANYEQIISLAEALEHDPEHPAASINRIKTHVGQDLYEQAIVDYTKAIELAPNHLSAYYQRGDVYYELSKFKLAVTDYAQAFILDENLYENPYNVYKFDSAITDYAKFLGVGEKPNYNYIHKTLKFDPNLSIVYYKRGGYYERDAFFKNERNYNEAINSFTIAIQLDPNYRLAYKERGDMYRRQGNFEAAIADYTKAIELKSDFAQVYYGRGIAYSRQGKYNEAIADFTQAIELKPEYTFAYYNRGVAYRDSNEMEKAITDFKRFLTFDPPRSWQGRVEAWLQELTEDKYMSN